MAERAHFELRLSGGTADQHNFQGYDGFMSLAGFALTLSLVTNYVETGIIRHRGDFPGRSAVRAGTLRPGSVIADYGVLLNAVVTGAVTGGSAQLLTSLVERVLARNLGQRTSDTNPDAAALVRRKSGDFEALVAATEPSIRQAHDVIGNGAKKIKVVGGVNVLNTFDKETKSYLRSSKKDPTILEANVDVTGFYGNTGHGSVFDHSLSRNVPIGMDKATLDAIGSVFSWGLDEWINKTGKMVAITYQRIVAMDGREKRYVILDAKPA